ncbi:thrombomodulin-like [Seriola lalandi dorsalis]|uniref:thrombomodulin-like n=2 Tax=Seriola TaxID=8160 RepID=UPI000C6F926C|nr:thrombomodulin-like [Seriola lalandi dorsalis]XP_056250031.1 thrombomodulin-like isoform X1 [Seriola aureovittata]
MVKAERKLDQDVLFKRFGVKQTGICRPICTGSDCLTVNQDRVDFETAEEACRVRNGELMTLQPQTDERILDNLSAELFGNFWIGLRLPVGACSNLSAPLRGYEWTSGGTRGSFIPSFSTWKDSVKVCSPHCVSLSNDQSWTERLCTDKTDGYLCRTKHKDACQAQELSDSKVLINSQGCKTAPCEHQCTPVEGSYKCSCFSGYIPDSKDPNRCKIHCDTQTCPKTCDLNPDSCYCPDGYIINENHLCEDIDECKMEQCQEHCKNTFGSFVCSCKEGFVLKDEVKCIKADVSESFDITTPVTDGSVKPVTNNNTLKALSPTTGGFVRVWIFVAVAVVVLIIVVKLYVVKRQKRREQNSSQQSTATAAVDNIEC